MSQNVLIAVIFNLQYCYILLGWERSADDGCILANAIQNQDFIILEDKYYLVDAGYPNSDHIMVPY